VEKEKVNGNWRNGTEKGGLSGIGSYKILGPLPLSKPISKRERTKTSRQRVPDGFPYEWYPAQNTVERKVFGDTNVKKRIKGGKNGPPAI